MSKCFKFVLAVIICVLTLCLPYKLRISLSEILGWGINWLYKTYINMVKYLVRESR